MKNRIIIIIVMSLLLVCVGAKNGCNDNSDNVATSEKHNVSGLGTFVKMQFEGHEYLVFDFLGAESGGAMCHSESCPCKPKTVFKPEQP